MLNFSEYNEDCGACWVWCYKANSACFWVSIIRDYAVIRLLNFGIIGKWLRVKEAYISSLGTEYMWSLKSS